jgi:hypothetical protein
VYYKDDCDFGLKANHFTFVAMKDFNSRKLAHDHLAKSAAQNVYERAAIINARTLANNRMLVNAGVPVERVAAATHTDIRKITIRDIPAGSSAAHGLPSASVVFRHELQAPVKPLRLVAPKVDEQHPVLPHPAIVPNGIASKTSGRPNGILHPGRPAPGALPPANPPHRSIRRNSRLVLPMEFMIRPPLR